MPKVSKTRYAVLGALTFGPATGYDIRRDFEQTVGHFWHESLGQIYLILNAQVREGLARVHTEAGQSGPVRRVYEIAAHGESVLDAWLIEPVSAHPPPRNETLLKLFFGCLLPSAVNLRAIADLRELAVAALASYAGASQSLDPLGLDTGEPYWQAALRFGELQAEAVLRWCNGTTSMLDQNAMESRGT